MLPDVDTLETFGGAKKNYSNSVDPETDEDAIAINRMKVDVAGATHTLVRAIRCFVGVTGANPTDPVSGLVHEAVWGNAPAVKPTVTRAPTGIWTVTWPALVDTELTPEDEERGGGLQQAINFQRAKASVECVGTLFHATARVLAANVVEVRGWTSGGLADDLNGLLVTVWAR